MRRAVCTGGFKIPKKTKIFGESQLPKSVALNAQCRNRKRADRLMELDGKRTKRYLAGYVQWHEEDE